MHLEYGSNYYAAFVFDPDGYRIEAVINDEGMLTSRRSQPPLALSVPLSRFTSRVGGGSAFFVDMANYCQVSNKSAFRNASFFGWSHHELF